MRFALLAAGLPLVHGHAILIDPPARTGMSVGVGAKLQPIGAAATFLATCGVTGNCGGSDVGGPAAVTKVYKSGAAITVRWTNTIPHDVDRLTAGVRVAVHFAAGDTYTQNVLISGADAGAGAGEKSVTVTLPAGKTCVGGTGNCVLQWSWVANNDGGSYIGAADISITADGTGGGGGGTTGGTTGGGGGTAGGAATGDAGATGDAAPDASGMAVLAVFGIIAALSVLGLVALIVVALIVVLKSKSGVVDGDGGGGGSSKSQELGTRGGGVGGGSCVALFAYTASQRDELSFAKGDRIQIIDKVETEWWTGAIRGEKGKFPSNYVKEISSARGST